MLPHLHNGQKVKIASVYRLRPTKVCKVELNWEYEWFVEHHWVLWENFRIKKSEGREAVTDNAAEWETSK